jgi:CRISPR/Cas system-associated exonuclease Cas4 (RecB family)
MIVERVIDQKAREIKQWPVRSNRASSLGHPCTRYLTLERTRWQEKVLHGPSLQMVFDIGNDIEDRVLRDLKDAGFTVIEQQRAFEWPEYGITGHIDAKVNIGSKVYPIEVKSMSPFVFEKTNTVADMLNSKYHYMRSYPAQMTLYLLMDNKETGFFILKNKSTGAMKEVEVNLDYELGEKLLQKASTINHHVEAGTLPEPIEWDDSICSQCGYLHVCNPVRTAKEIDIIDDDELLEMLAKRESLTQAHKEYEEIDGILKEKLEGRDKLLIGDYYITGSWRKRTGYDVPKDIKEQYKFESLYWVRKIAKITEQAKK